MVPIHPQTPLIHLENPLVFSRWIPRNPSRSDQNQAALPNDPGGVPGPTHGCCKKLRGIKALMEKKGGFFVPHIFVWGSCFWFCNPGFSSSSRRLRNTTHTNLTYNNFTHTNLTHTNLTDNNFTHTNLTYNNFTHTNLTYTNLTHTNFTHTNLTYNNFTHTNFTYNNFTHTKT